jgi:hypothetical protein
MFISRGDQQNFPESQPSGLSFLVYFFREKQNFPPPNANIFLEGAS